MFFFPSRNVKEGAGWSVVDSVTHLTMMISMKDSGDFSRGAHVKTKQSADF